MAAVEGECRRMKPTHEAVSEQVLLTEVFGLEPDDDTSFVACGCVETCAGEWRREPDGLWRFWEGEE